MKAYIVTNNKYAVSRHVNNGGEMTENDIVEIKMKKQDTPTIVLAQKFEHYGDAKRAEEAIMKSDRLAGTRYEIDQIEYSFHVVAAKIPTGWLCLSEYVDIGWADDGHLFNFVQHENCWEKSLRFFWEVVKMSDRELCPDLAAQTLKAILNKKFEGTGIEFQVIKV